jgi:hypothetical protein
MLDRQNVVLGDAGQVAETTMRLPEIRAQSHRLLKERLCPRILSRSRIQFTQIVQQPAVSGLDPLCPIQRLPRLGELTTRTIAPPQFAERVAIVRVVRHRLFQCG